MDVAVRANPAHEYTVLLLVPRTRRVGFFLLLSYLGGIIATRAPHDVNHVGIVLTALLWAGMYFEDPELFRRSPGPEPAR